MDKNDRLIHSRRKRIRFPFFNNENRPNHKQMNRLDILINNLTNENTIKKIRTGKGLLFFSSGETMCRKFHIFAQQFARAATERANTASSWKTPSKETNPRRAFKRFGRFRAEIRKEKNGPRSDLPDAKLENKPLI